MVAVGKASGEATSAPAAYETFTLPRGGLGVRLTKALPAGSLVFSEPPLFELPSMMFTNNTKPGIVQEIMKLGLGELKDEDKRAFLALGNCFKDDARPPAGEETPGEPMLFNATVPRDPLSGIFLTNCSGTAEKQLGVFRIASRLNHSCTPNSRTIFAAKTTKLLSLHTLVDLPAGAELTVPYLDVLSPIATRQEQLFERYRFNCRCQACALSFGRDDTSAGMDLKLAKASEMRRRRIGLLKQVLRSWAERKVRGVTVMNIAKEVLAPGGTLDQEGLVVLKADLWQDVCEVAASHSSIKYVREAASAAHEAYLIETGPKSTQTVSYAQLLKDPRKHTAFGKRDYVDFDAPGEQEVDLAELIPGWEGDLVTELGSLTLEDAGAGKKKKKKKKKKSKKAKANGDAGAENGADAEGEGYGEGEEDGEKTTPKDT